MPRTPRAWALARTHFFGLALLTVTLGSAFAEDRNWEEANALLTRASELEVFKADETPKYRQVATFIFHHTNKGTLKGTYQCDYLSPERWRDEITVADVYQQQRVRIEKQTWTKRSTDLTPLQVEQFLHALYTTSFRMSSSDVVNRVHKRKLDGAENRCIEFSNVVGHSSTDGEICLDQATSTVSYWKYGDREIWYSQYVPVAGRVRPSHLVVAEKGNTSVEADLTYTLNNELTPESFAPVADAEVSEVCNSTRPLQRKSSPEPYFPPGLSKNQFKGPVVVRAEVDGTGHVQKAAVIESLHPILDTAALEAVKHWTFEPRLCDGKPVNAVTRLDVWFIK